MTPEVRDACYQQIRSCMKDGVVAYYKVHPELLGDKRSEDAIRESMEGLKCIFKILDGYKLIPIEDAAPLKTLVDP